MNPHHEWEWLTALADDDHQAARAYLAMSISPAITCFHAQQAIEKYMKAVLSFHRIRFPFTHDLEELHALLEARNIMVPVGADALAELNPFAVKQRYDKPPQVRICVREVLERVRNIADWCTMTLSSGPAHP
jgi:HEPN domain-containing protein